jgi:hypothetical protein
MAVDYCRAVPCYSTFWEAFINMPFTILSIAPSLVFPLRYFEGLHWVTVTLQPTFVCHISKFCLVLQVSTPCSGADREWLWWSLTVLWCTFILVSVDTALPSYLFWLICGDSLPFSFVRQYYCVMSGSCISLLWYFMYVNFKGLIPM